MCIGYMQKCHFIERTWAPENFGTPGSPRANLPCRYKGMRMSV